MQRSGKMLAEAGGALERVIRLAMTPGSMSFKRAADNAQREVQRARCETVCSARAATQCVACEVVQRRSVCA